MLWCVLWNKFTDVSDVLAVSIIRAKKQAASTSETSVNIYQTAHRNIPKDFHLLCRKMILCIQSPVSEVCIRDLSLNVQYFHRKNFPQCSRRRIKYLNNEQKRFFMIKQKIFLVLSLRRKTYHVFSLEETCKHFITAPQYRKRTWDEM
jgi:hypothetical protein